MKTIRTKLFLLFFVSIVSLVGFGLILNTFFLETFYIYKNEENFVSMSDMIQQELKKDIMRDVENVERYIEELGRDHEINIEVVSQEAKILYSSVPKGQRGELLPGEIEKLFIAQQKFLKSNYVYKTVEKENQENQSPKLVYIQSVGKNDYLILSKPLKGIRESVQITNQFGFFTGGLIILVGGLVIWILSRKVTRPILEMNRVAEQISELDFENHVNVTSEDEIGQLGSSINAISEKLDLSINELKADIDRRKRLVRDISHELKTPIGVIKGYSEGLSYGVADTPEKVSGYLNTIVDECNRMDQMVKELLELSKYEYSEKKLDIRKFKVNDIFNTLSERFMPIFDESGIVFDKTIQVESEMVADYNLISRALSNYLTNAVKYIDDRKVIKMSAHEDSEGIIISVYNSGDAIPEVELAKIWDVFYKIDETRTRSSAGSGLGLSIVSQVVKLHNGQAFAVNKKEGVEFNLKIPHNFT